MDVATRSRVTPGIPAGDEETIMQTCLAPDIEPWCDLVRTEYQEMPGLRLTLDQARRLWSFDAATCRDVLETLIESRFLVETDDHQYCRADHIDGAASLD